MVLKNHLKVSNIRKTFFYTIKSTAPLINFLKHLKYSTTSIFHLRYLAFTLANMAQKVNNSSLINYSVKLYSNLRFLIDIIIKPTLN